MMKTEEQKKKHAEYMREWRHKNIEDQKAKHANYMKSWRKGLSDEQKENRRKKSAELRAKTPKKYVEYSHKWQKNNPEKNRAHKAIYRAINRGDLKRKPCEQCLKDGIENMNVQGHHEDYSKPLEIVWLCSQHHRDVHGQKQRSQKGE